VNGKKVFLALAVTSALGIFGAASAAAGRIATVSRVWSRAA
jgi:hypothetical protein